MPSQTRFSVVITSYNYRDYVTAAVDGALAQTHPPCEVIVVDDGSSDGSVQLLRERYGEDPRVSLVCQDNGGQLSAFLAGLRRARGEIVCFLDSDDHWSPGYLHKLAEAYASGEADFVISDMQVFDQESRVIGYGTAPVDFGYTAISTAVTGCWYGAPTSALSMRKTWAQRSLDLPEHFVERWKLSADNCLVYGASVLGARKLYLPTAEVHYRIHGNNGWWANRGPGHAYRNRLDCRVLIDHYARTAAIGAWAPELAKLEFRTKPAPSWPETRRYASIALRGDAPWWRRAEQALAIVGSRLGGRKAEKPAPAPVQ
ncbi:glycosyltransferase family 2 protein [Lysobacter sp. H21R4]|uniref:glycosyltransferase family 2 protein n=1 Tax=Lysobacter sp. H21R4 TaxID=2781021 RepID=UPI00188958F7|nr:glycosyltransferase family 2 protein [Lysobacter sp. H21R4]QOY62933.1 glycosyltransferase family 2 protein [Lysobacter sp. H21R4]